MRYAVFFTLIMLFTIPAYSQDESANKGYVCNDGIARGKVMEIALKFSDLVRKVASGKSMFEDLIGFQKTYGIPFTVAAITERPRGYNDYFVTDGSAGKGIIVFLKEMKMKANSGLSFEKIREFSSLTEKKPNRTWPAPFNQSEPVGLLGDELIESYPILQTCWKTDESPQAVPAWIAIKPNGTYRLLGSFDEKANPIKLLDSKKCPRTGGTVSSFRLCAEFHTIGSAKKSILVWDGPAT